MCGGDSDFIVKNKFTKCNGGDMNKKSYYVFATVLGTIMASAMNIMALNNGHARTPPMGFNTWNYFGCKNSSGHGDVNEALMKGIADAFVSKGMKDVGYQYVNVDDGFALANRNASGGLVADPKYFPSGMKALSDYCHSKGVKFGLYTDVGNVTCATCYGTCGFPGLLNHEQQDCDTFVAWGIDYIKVDFCCFNGDAVSTYTKVRNCLTAAVTRMKPTVPDAHSICFSICNWGNQNPWNWGDTVGNLWRTTGDINNSWGSMLGNSDNSCIHYDKARIGSWNDPDMLEVGYGDFATNYAQARAHFSLWCIQAAPLIAGNDVRNMSASIQDILTNKDAIAIDQDTLGGDMTMGIIQGRRIVSGNSEVWVKLLKGKKQSEYAVLFFNRNNSGAVSMNVTTQQIAQVGGDIANGNTYKVRDIWGKKDLADWTAGGTYTTPATVPVHDVFMIRLSLPGVSVATDIKTVAEKIRFDIDKKIIVKVVKSSPVTISMVDLKGAVVFSKRTAGAGDYSISTSGIRNGVYLIKVRSGSETFVQRVMLK